MILRLPVPAYVATCRWPSFLASSTTFCQSASPVGAAAGFGCAAGAVVGAAAGAGGAVVGAAAGAAGAAGGGDEHAASTASAPPRPIRRTACRRDVGCSMDISPFL